jgi:hypothetical protein
MPQVDPPKIAALKKQIKKADTEMFAQRVKTALNDGLKAVDIKAKITTEPIPNTKLLRVSAVAEKFESLRPSERQDLVWRIVSKSLSDAEQLRISMILTLTPKEEMWE